MFNHVQFPQSHHISPYLTISMVVPFSSPASGPIRTYSNVHHRGDGMGDATILRLVRLLRLARMTRVAKLLRAFPEVLIMIKGRASSGVWYPLVI